MADETDFRLGQCARLVGAQDIHGTEIVNGLRPLDDDAAFREPLRSLANVTVMTIGSNSGVSPTAKATANNSDSSQGRW